ncbi:MAG: type II toxin-antitoxin system RelE/ParE family toxin [Oscillospiraceae bacterium]|nr:type II toxin-antitoxin system RelE/ParE family toxin [Oscillospiraceae bacterium]
MIKYSKEAEKFILSQGKAVALRLYKSIEKLPLGDVKRLQGKKKLPLYRLRVGDFRIVFSYERDTILVLRADNRGDVYKRI